MSLPPIYYGTVDATALWILLLHDAWSWGMPETAVHELLGALEAAAGWLSNEAAPDADRLLKYIDESGSGLSNQGWKDSGDAVRNRDGSVAQAPIALVEAQAYASHALECAARLVEAFGRGGSETLRARADELRLLIRTHYWVEERDGTSPRHLGLAIDGNGHLVDGLASNMGHVLGTGCLTAREAELVAAEVTGPELLDRFGVRTLGRANGGYNPIGYHTGSIWTHDTAIIALGLAQEGRTAQAVTVARTLLASAEAFAYRWPELYSGTAALERPAPYPAACRPQAWSAAAAVALLTVALGLRPDRAWRTLHVHPARPAAYGPMRVEGLRFFGGRVDLDIAHDDVRGSTRGLHADRHDPADAGIVEIAKRRSSSLSCLRHTGQCRPRKTTTRLNRPPAPLPRPRSWVVPPRRGEERGSGPGRWGSASCRRNTGEGVRLFRIRAYAGYATCHVTPDGSGHMAAT